MKTKMIMILKMRMMKVSTPFLKTRLKVVKKRMKMMENSGNLKTRRKEGAIMKFTIGEELPIIIWIDFRGKISGRSTPSTQDKQQRGGKPKKCTQDKKIQNYTS